jgi:hypothetical protein
MFACRRDIPKGAIVKLFQFASLSGKRSAGIVATSLSGALCLCATVAAQAAPASQTADAGLTEAWRAAITRTDVPGKGCFAAEYPGTVWIRVACTKASHRPLLPAHGPSGFIVGNGNDHAAETGVPISSAVGSFPSIKGLTQETNEGASDTYSLQLNSSYYVSPVCQGAQIPSECRA